MMDGRDSRDLCIRYFGDDDRIEKGHERGKIKISASICAAFFGKGWEYERWVHDRRQKGLVYPIPHHVSSP